MLYLKPYFILFFSLVAGNLLSAQAVFGQTDVKVVKFDGLDSLLHNTEDTLYVVNFWATWCKPCVEELPYFEKANQTFATKPVKIILVSMDLKKDIPNKLLPFMKRRNILSDVWLLDDTKYNSWIDKVEPAWSGAIPATIIFNNSENKRTFIERPFKEGELSAIIATYL